VRDLGVFDQVARGGHDDRDAGLVVSAQQRGARGGDDVLTRLFSEIGVLGRRQHQIGRVGKGDVVAVPALGGHSTQAGALRRSHTLWPSAAFACIAAAQHSGRIYGPSQYRDHRACRPRQDDPGRRASETIGNLPRKPGGGRARDGFERYRT
jgi:hypothetical protein